MARASARKCQRPLKHGGTLHRRGGQGGLLERGRNRSEKEAATSVARIG